MKHFFALLLSVLMVLSLLTACGDKTTPSDGDDQTVTDENGSDTDNNTDDTTDPYPSIFIDGCTRLECDFYSATQPLSDSDRSAYF